MKQLLTSLFALTVVVCSGQKIEPHNQDTTDMLREYRKDILAKGILISPDKITHTGTLSLSIDTLSPSIIRNNLVFNNSTYWQFTTDGSKRMLYSIKADGTIELGDLIIEAVIKGLEKKGYVLIKRVEGQNFIRIYNSLSTKFTNN